ncbi:DUF4041 domain-containing protein [Fructobacillus tropaeoli]|uniref:DUF4041 domain-containing protein n=1 Tax=Fructobacillus tropaeoli TaxID=709323 RepID=UPI00194438D7|nr:DUF4041 domain-containing protein [Fructobacillus tropaeoli]GIC70577.1 hypothetical protein FT12353_12520 [Fructobacillus tropaeoli]
MGLFSKKDEQLERKIGALEEKLRSKQEQFDEIMNRKYERLGNLNDQINDANNELKALNNDIEMGFYEPTYQFMDSIQLKEKLKTIVAQEKQLVKEKRAYVILNNYTFNGSASMGRSMQEKSGAALIRAFNGEATGIINKVTASNFDKKIDALSKSCEKLNDLFTKSTFVMISHEYFVLKTEELKLSIEYALKKQDEKDIIREQRLREREERQLEAEVAVQQKKIEKEISQYKNALEKLEAQEQTDELLEQIAKLKAEIEQLENDHDELDNRLFNSKAGYVYIISNVGSFGENVYKIGVTRRLTPMDRIDELGSASVPFKFDVHALIFSEDAFQLESELHQEFTNRRVNHINKRKEYFNVSLSEIKDFIIQKKNITIEWHDIPENSEFELSEKSSQQVD